jgi:hypothetical protein
MELRPRHVMRDSFGARGRHLFVSPGVTRDAFRAELFLLQSK